MSSNKAIREEMEKIYGDKCMFKEAKIEEQIDELNKKRQRKIKTYRVYVEECRYKRSKKIAMETLLSYHHLRHKSGENGQNTVENGALVNSLAHQYMHSLPRQDEEIINNMLREYKGQAPEKLEEKKKKYKKVKVELVDDLDTGVDVKFTPIEFYQPTLEEYIVEQEEKEQFAKYLEERRKRQLEKFKKQNDSLDTSIERPKAHIDEEWQKEIMQDVLDELRY